MSINTNFSIFQGGGRGFLKFQMYNGRNGQEGRTASPCHISWRSLKQLPRYGDF